MTIDKNRIRAALWSEQSIEHWDYFVGLVPELSPNYDLPQSPIWHPEGPVHVHICQVIDACAKYRDIDLSLVALFHDIGKARAHTIKTDDAGNPKISQRMHEVYSSEIVQKYREFIESAGGNYEMVLECVTEHMRAHAYVEGKMVKPEKRAEFEALTYYDRILMFEKADQAGKR